MLTLFPATEEAEEDGWLRDLDLGVIAVCYSYTLYTLDESEETGQEAGGVLADQQQHLSRCGVGYAVYNVNIISAIALQHWKEVQSRHSVSY